MTLQEIESTLLLEIQNREAFSRSSFVAARKGEKVDADAIANTLTELRVLRSTLQTLKKGG